MDSVFKLSEEMPEIKVIFRDFPILSDSSKTAALAALAADKQGKYIEFHSALLNYRGGINQELIFSTATDLELDIELLKKDMQSEEVNKKLSDTIEIAQKLNIRGTPTFIIGDKVKPGAFEFDALKNV